MDEVPLHATFRPQAPGGPTLGDRDLHVWAVPLQGDCERWAALLSPAEKDRAARFRVVDHRRRYAAWHGALRVILGGYLGADPLALEFETGARGKPRLHGRGKPGGPDLRGQDDLHFNLSHSGQLAMVAVGRVEVGVDLEKLRHLESLREIAGRHFSRAEFAALEATPEAAQLTAFYRCWTRKEAYVKATGLGLASALDAFDVAIGEEAALLALRDSDDQPTDWALHDVSPGPDYIAALAVRARGLQVRTLALREG